jgi:hypothetical protein
MILVSRLFQGSVRKPSVYFTVASLTFPYPGEQLNGDGWSYRIIDGKSRFFTGRTGLATDCMLKRQADRAVDIFSAADGPLEDVLMRMQCRTSKHPGAAASILEIAHESGRYALQALEMYQVHFSPPVLVIIWYHSPVPWELNCGR